MIHQITLPGNIDIKQVIIDAIEGTGGHSTDFCIRAEASGLMKFTGNQWNPNWEFVDSELQEAPLDKLMELYFTLKELK